MYYYYSFTFRYLFLKPVQIIHRFFLTSTGNLSKDAEETDSTWKAAIQL